MSALTSQSHGYTPVNDAPNLSCPVAVVRGRLERQRRLHAAGAGPSLLQTLHLQEDACWVSNDRCSRLWEIRLNSRTRFTSLCSQYVAFRYNLLFFVSGGGKFNYQGTKRWLEDNLDHTGAARPRSCVLLDTPPEPCVECSPLLP